MTYRLISKERDYYDYAFHAYGFDPKKVFTRKEEQFILDTSSDTFFLVGNYASNNKSMFTEKDVSYFVGVCGEWYRAVPTIKEDAWLYCGFNNDKVLFNDVFDEYERQSVHSNPRYLKRSLARRKAKSVKQYDKKINITDHSLFKRYDAAVLLVEVRRINTYITKYPVLKDINFSTIMNATEIHQEIEMYLESTLAKYEEIGCIPNENKILSAGFDLKQSFRHRGNK
jgi:hypothetical protein